MHVFANCFFQVVGRLMLKAVEGGGGGGGGQVITSPGVVKTIFVISLKDNIDFYNCHHDSKYNFSCIK